MMGGNGVKKKCATWVVTTILQQKAEATRDQRERERRKKKERGASLLCCCCCCLPRSIRGGAAQIWGVCVCGAVARESGTCPPSPTKAPLSPREVNYSAIDAQARGESNAPRCVSVCVDLLFLRQLVTNTWFYASLTREHTLTTRRSRCAPIFRGKLACHWPPRYGASCTYERPHTQIIKLQTAQHEIVFSVV